MADGCDTCGGSGVLHSASEDPVALVAVYDLDHVVRCDTCQRFRGDLDAARWIASQSVDGGYIVYALTLDGHLPATEESRIFVRHSTGDISCLQESLLAEAPREQLDYQIPDWYVMCETIDPA